MLTTCIFKQPLNVIDIIVSHEDFKLLCYVSIDQLHPNQLNLDNDVVNMKRKNPKKNSLPYVVFKNGNLILIDGHHTVTAKIQKGIKKVKCLLCAIGNGL